MIHTHNMAEDMLNFQIDIATRKLINVSGKKGFLVQRDHDSKIVVFRIPRLVEGHDMAECNEIRIHYINISKNRKQKTEGVYEVRDKTVSADGECVEFSWKISGNATGICGALYFLVQFSCVPGDIDYVWHTEICKEIKVSEGMDHAEVIVEEYADVLEQWKQRLFGNEDCLKESLTKISDKITDHDGEISSLQLELDKKVNKSHAKITGSLSMERRVGTTVGGNSTALGVEVTASGHYSHAEGQETKAIGQASHTEGRLSESAGNYSHAEGYETKSIGSCSHTEGSKTTCNANNSHAEGYNTQANENQAHAEGHSSIASGKSSHAEGQETVASGYVGHAEGYRTVASGLYSHAEGEGYNCKADTFSTNNDMITAWYKDKFARAAGNASHVEGRNSLAVGSCSHVEGHQNLAKGAASHAEGENTKAEGDFSHSEGKETKAIGYCQHVQGKYNAVDIENKYAHIVGNGTIDTKRSNAYTLDWEGNAEYAGKVSQKGTPNNDNDLTTKKYVDSRLAEACEYIMLMNDGLYEGRDLTNVFATEIAKYSEEWEWIKSRIVANNFTGIHIGDYIPITVNGERVEMQVAGIDTHYHLCNPEVGHHIDFISRDCYSQLVKWNNEKNNNGTSANPYPYQASDLWKWLNNTLYELLPYDIQCVITYKYTILERRYSAAGALTESTTMEHKNMGKLWVPHEYEVFGSVIRGTIPWSQGQAVQYPIFANSWRNRAKGAGHGGKRCNWWTATVDGLTSTHICGVSESRNDTVFAANNNTVRVPICFRIDDSTN